MMLRNALLSMSLMLRVYFLFTYSILNICQIINILTALTWLQYLNNTTTCTIKTNVLLPRAYADFGYSVRVFCLLLSNTRHFNKLQKKENERYNRNRFATLLGYHK